MEEKIKKYSELISKTGLNLKKGQKLVISAPVEAAQFARLCATEAYNAGCGEVIMRWTDDYISRERFLKGADEIFDVMPEWQKHFYNDYSAEGTAFLSIYASDPEALKGVDPDRLKRANISAGKALEDYRNRQMSNYFQWCIVSVPTESWAKKVFPQYDGKEAIGALWDAILKCVRVEENSDPVENWKKHIETLSEKKEKLTKLSFKALHYVSEIGTDLTVELPENHVWEGGSEKTAEGIEFCANMPTEEVFTAPKKDGVNGVVVASKPLVLGGNIVEGLRFEIKEGKIIKVTAEKGVEIVEKELQIDEGASYLGEVALVPFDSPISNSGILFYNTLFDENASCHFAFGKAYPCVVGGAVMSAEEQKAAGLNDSITHVDFMIGTRALSITGIKKNGEKIPVFKDGNFAL